jgi:hypothetical protein
LIAIWVGVIRTTLNLLPTDKQYTEGNGTYQHATGFDT